MNNVYFYIYVVVSKCSRNHFISNKFKTLQPFKLHFSIIFLCNYTLLPGYIKVLDTLLEDILWNRYSFDADLGRGTGEK
jgi:hypothetical protein